MTKQCVKCKNRYTPAIKFFSLHKHTKDGLHSWCKECSRKSRRDWYQKNKLKVKLYQQKYYAAVKGYLRYVYGHIKRRCTNPDDEYYYNYGGRGIQNKFKSANEFVDYIINVLKVDPRGLEIDRINNNGNYEPGNIQFVTKKENCNNRRKRL
jgi:hypothetical protein